MTVRTIQRELTGKTHGCELMESNMALSTRRQFGRRTEFGARGALRAPD
jgi:hypothetical protein